MTPKIGTLNFLYKLTALLTSISDIFSRFKRMQGFEVLHPMGFDSFGLPAEQYAIQTGQRPEDTTRVNIDGGVDKEGKQIVIKKKAKKVFDGHGSDLQLIASLIPSGTIKWKAGIDEKIKARYIELVAPR